MLRVGPKIGPSPARSCEHVEVSCPRSSQHSRTLRENGRPLLVPALGIAPALPPLEPEALPAPKPDPTVTPVPLVPAFVPFSRPPQPSAAAKAIVKTTNSTRSTRLSLVDASVTVGNPATDCRPSAAPAGRRHRCRRRSSRNCRCKCPMRCDNNTGNSLLRIPPPRPREVMASTVAAAAVRVDDAIAARHANVRDVVGRRATANARSLRWTVRVRKAFVVRTYVCAFHTGAGAATVGPAIALGIRRAANSGRRWGRGTWGKARHSNFHEAGRSRSPLRGADCMRGPVINGNPLVDDCRGVHAGARTSAGARVAAVPAGVRPALRPAAGDSC
jgi:hypothetical protein